MLYYECCHDIKFSEELLSNCNKATDLSYVSSCTLHSLIKIIIIMKGVADSGVGVVPNCFAGVDSVPTYLFQRLATTV